MLSAFPLVPRDSQQCNHLTEGCLDVTESTLRSCPLPTSCLQAAPGRPCTRSLPARCLQAAHGRPCTRSPSSDACVAVHPALAACRMRLLASCPSQPWAHSACTACRMHLLASRPSQPRAPKCAQGSSTTCQVPSGASSHLRPAMRAVREAAALLSKRYAAVAVADRAAASPKQLAAHRHQLST